MKRDRPMSRVPAKRSTLALLALAAGLAACGGDDEAGGEGAAAFLEQVDAVCVDASESFVELTREPVTTPEQGEALDTEVVELREETVTRLRELEPPQELQADYDAYLSAEEELSSANEELAEAFADGDRGRIQALLEQLDAAEQESEDAAAEVGLEACAGELPEEDLAEIGSTAREYLTSTDPAICSELATDKLIAEAYRDLESCEREVEGREPPSEVTTSGPSGAGPSASLEAQLSGGETLDILLVQEDGEWKVDVVNPGA